MRADDHAPACFVLNEMGTGKTKAALWSFDWLLRTRRAKKMLVVAPLSTIDFVWGQEIMQTLPGTKYQIIYGSQERRMKACNTDADIYIINHDGLKVKPVFERAHAAARHRHDLLRRGCRVPQRPHRDGQSAQALVRGTNVGVGA